MPVVEFITSSGLGSLLGMRHALEPDHLAAVSTLITGERDRYRAAWLGACWGLGHTLSLLAVGALLATPYVYLYDVMVLAVAVAFLVRLALKTGFLPGEPPALLAAALLIFSFPFVEFPVGFFAILIVAALVLRRIAAKLPPLTLASRLFTEVKSLWMRPFLQWRAVPAALCLLRCNAESRLFREGGSVSCVE